VAEREKPSKSASEVIPSPEFFIALSISMIALGLYGQRVDIGHVALFSGVLVAVGGAIASAVRWQKLTIRGKAATAILVTIPVAIILLLLPML